MSTIILNIFYIYFLVVFYKNISFLILLVKKGELMLIIINSYIIYIYQITSKRLYLKDLF